MYHSRYWFKRKVREACRRNENAGESERQTVYTLFLAFVPFAAIVVALAVASNAQLVQALALAARQADAALDRIRVVFGAAEDADPEALVRQAIWAAKNKEKIEIRFVETAPRESLCWMVSGSLGSIAFAARDGYREDQTGVLAKLSRAQREEAMKVSVLSWVAGQLEGLTVLDLSKKALAAAAKVAAQVNAAEEQTVYAAFLDKDLQRRRLTQADLELKVADPTGVQDIAASAGGKQKVASWIATRKQGFRDPPKTCSEIETSVIESFCSTQPVVLWSEFQQLRTGIHATNVPAPRAPIEFSPQYAEGAKGTLARMRGQIVSAVLKADQLGPLTELEAGRRARTIFDEAKSNMERALLAALPVQVDLATQTQVGALVRKDGQAARIAIEKHLLAGCCNGLDEASRTAGLTREGLTGFPQVLRQIDERTGQEQGRIEQLVCADVKRRIDELSRSEKRLDEIVAQLPATILTDVANALASNKLLDASSLPVLGDLTASAKGKLGELSGDPNPSGYPLLKDELAALNAALLAHLERRAKDYESQILKDVGSVSADELDSLRGLIDLSRFRDASLVHRVQEEIEKKRPGVSGLKAAQQNAGERAKVLVQAVKADLQGRLEKRVKARLLEQLRGVTESPENPDARKNLAREQFAKVFPIAADDVRGEQADLEPAVDEQWLEDVQRYLNQMAIDNAIRTLQLAGDLDPFAADAASVAQQRFVKAVSDKIGIPQGDILKLRQERLSERVSGLLGKAQTDREQLQQEAVAGLSESDLPVEMAGAASDVAKAIPPLERRLIEKLGHAQLGSQIKSLLATKAQSLVAARGKQTADAQLAEIERLTVQDLPASAVRRIVEDKQTEARTEATRLLNPLIRTRTHADALIAPAGTELAKKAETLVAQRRKSVLLAQWAAVNAFSVATDTNLPAQVIQAIVAAEGKEEGGLAVVKEALLGKVGERTRTPQVLGGVKLDATDRVAVFAEVLPLLNGKSSEMVKEIHAKECQTQQQRVAKQIDNYNIEPLSGQSLDELLTVCVEAVCALADIQPDQRLPATRKFLREELRSKVGTAHAELAKLEQGVNGLIDELAGQPDVGKILGGSGPSEPPSGGAPGGPKGRLLGNRTAAELRAILEELRPVAHKRKAMARGDALVNDIAWQPEWFRFSYFIEADSEAQKIIKSLEQEGIESAAAYRSEIKSKLEQRHTEIYNWCEQETKKVLASQAQQLLDEKLAAYRAGTRDFSEWFPSGTTVDDKKLAAEVEDIVNRLTGLTPGGE